MTATAESFFGAERIGGAALHPDGTLLAYTSDAEGRNGVWTVEVSGAGGEPVDVWPADADVDAKWCVWRPDGQRLLVLTDTGGSENTQLYELDPRDRTLTRLTDAAEATHALGAQHWSEGQPYSADSRRLAFASNARDRTVFDVVVRDLDTGAERMVLTGDDRYFATLWSPDGRWLLVRRLHQNTEHDLSVCDLDTGEIHHVTPHEGLANYRPLAWSRDGEGCYLVAAEGQRDLAGVAFLDLRDVGATSRRTGRLRWIVTSDEHEIGAATISEDGRRLVYAVNVDGCSRVRLRDLDTGDDRAVGGFPTTSHVPELMLTPDGRTLVAKVMRSTAPDEVYAVDLDATTRAASDPGPESRSGSGAGAGAGSNIRPVTRCGTGVPGGLVEPEVVHLPGEDGVSIQALLFRPPAATAASPLPVVMSIHGGPEAQEVPGWQYTGDLYQHLVANGVGVLAPNVRGSSGFGLRYQRAIYRHWGDRDVRDFAACAEYLRGLSWVDPDRLGVFGGSYGGFATLSCLSRLPEYWTVGVDLFGPSDLALDARTAPPSWQRRVVAWLGDPDADAEMLRQHSPLTYAADIRVPLLVIQGAADARVARESSDVIVERLRELGHPVEYRVIIDGHGFTSRDTYVEMMSLSADWLLRHLVSPTR